MNAKALGTIVVVVTVAAVGIAWNQARATRVAEATMATLQAKRAALGAERQQDSDQARTLGGHADELRVERDRLQKARAAADAAAAANRPANPPPLASPMERLHDDPKLQVLWLASRRALVSENYGPFFSALGLSAEQVAKFQDLAIKREEQNLDLAATMRTQGLSGRDPVVQKLQRDADAELEAGRSDLLGATGAEQLKQYERELPVRDIVSGMAGTAAVRGIPFSPAQAEELTQALAAASALRPESGKIDPTTIDWAAADARAKAILTGAQFTLFQTIEPERGNNLRFGSQFANAVKQATKAEAAAAKPGG